MEANQHPTPTPPPADGSGPVSPSSRANTSPCQGRTPRRHFGAKNSSLRVLLDLRATAGWAPASQHPRVSRLCVRNTETPRAMHPDTVPSPHLPGQNIEAQGVGICISEEPPHPSAAGKRGFGGQGCAWDTRHHAYSWRQGPRSARPLNDQFQFPKS